MEPLRFDPFSPAVDADPFPLYRRLRDEAPCFWSDDAQMWILSRYADVFAALNNWKVFSSASGNMMTELPDRAGAARDESNDAVLLPAPRAARPWLVATLTAAAAVVLFLLVRTDRGATDGDAPLASGTGPSVAALSHELLDTVSLLERPIDTELRDEARNLLLDTSRVVEGVVRGLPAPLRAPLLEKL